MFYILFTLDTTERTTCEQVLWQASAVHLQFTASACWADQGSATGAAVNAEAKMVGSLITEGGDFSSRPHFQLAMLVLRRMEHIL